MTDAALTTQGLSKRYGRTWALRDCTLTLPQGRIAALVGPNGAGKTTLLRLAAGLLTPTAGDLEIFGASPQTHLKRVLPQIGYLAQEHPLYPHFSIADMLTLGRKLNPRWDDAIALRRLRQLAIPLDRHCDKLSGGQQAQVALALALAKRPALLLLDEPIASLDPLARREFLGALMEAAADGETTILFSSHHIAELERVCDYLIILANAQTQLTGEIEPIVASHKRLIGPSDRVAAIASTHTIIAAEIVGRGATLIVRTTNPVLDPVWQIEPVTLEDIVLAYLGQARDALPPTAPPQKREVAV